MNPTIEAALIAAGSGFFGALVGVGATVVVARFGFRSTREAVAAGSADVRAQIEADRRNRLWEKQAAAYTDAIAGVRHHQRVRHGQVQGMITGAKSTSPAAPVDWPQLEARLAAYSSSAVLDALRAATSAGERFEDAVGMWAVYVEQAQTPGRPPGGPHPGDARKNAEAAAAEANRLEDKVIDIIREELHAGTVGAPGAPVPLGSPAEPAAQ